MTLTFTPISARRVATVLVFVAVVIIAALVLRATQVHVVDVAPTTISIPTTTELPGT